MGFGVDSDSNDVSILIFFYGFLFFGFGWLDFLLWIFVFWTLDSNEVWVQHGLVGLVWHGGGVVVDIKSFLVVGGVNVAQWRVGGD